MDNSELRELYEKASIGPWWADGAKVFPPGSCGIIECCGIAECHHGSQEAVEIANAELIAAARNNLPRLLADSDELAALRARIAEAAVVTVRETGATFGHGCSGLQYVIGDDYMGPPECASLKGQRVALLRLPAGEGE